MRGRRLRRRREWRPEPWCGYKLAFPMISADGQRAGFTGVSLGASSAYGVLAEAECTQGAKHRSPCRWCDCGFYCFHEYSEARGLSCDPQYTGAMALQVQAFGRYIRYDKGLRYARQRVTAAQVGRCGCGQAAEVLADTGTGIVGWRRLLPVCWNCLPPRPPVRLGEFAALAGGIPVHPDPLAVPGRRAEAAEDERQIGPVLMAEMALLHARLDELRTQLDKLTHGDGG